MKIEVNRLSAEVTVPHPRIKDADALEVRVVLTNESAQHLRLNAMVLDVALLVLRVQQPDGTPVPFMPPPTPQVDDGQIGRIELQPGGAKMYTYFGRSLFGDALAPGKYEVRFLYDNTAGGPGEWTGRIESGWIGFEVGAWARR
jgi:hypothetical protein